ncbi:EPIDERMAL PATTERNING FACTOR-like protein 2 [Chenopodium quinoa]|uniref:EPIDERMAL PATTERNING FACTOR-like protein 2 n=1 Tax=Chenopodium quinoa TaxID=63459 RepID=UPI000B776E22|nr:EPIDERMAL PATTERNING FACTOR-like protein 2 [Chenopodium quinoa]
MGFPQNHVFPITNTLQLFSLLFFLASTFTQLQQQQPFLAQGLSIPQQNMALKVQKKKLIGRALIGSSPLFRKTPKHPPRCQGRCNNCGHCEAIQVPIVPQKGFPRSHFMHSTPTIAYSRGDGLSNYKPMKWKCKCGNIIFNP